MTVCILKENLNWLSMTVCPVSTKKTHLFHYISCIVHGNLSQMLYIEIFGHLVTVANTAVT